MRQSRYLWLIGIITLSMIGMIWWKTPEVVLTTLASPNYSDSSRSVVQNYWNLLDRRQISQARELIINNEITPAGRYELLFWENLVDNNPLLSLQKVEFLDNNDERQVVAKVIWTSSGQEVKTATYAFEAKQTDKGWRIKQVRRINSLSLIGGY